MSMRPASTKIDSRRRWHRSGPTRSAQTTERTCARWPRHVWVCLCGGGGNKELGNLGSLSKHRRAKPPIAKQPRPSVRANVRIPLDDRILRLQVFSGQPRAVTSTCVNQTLNQRREIYVYVHIHTYVKCVVFRSGCCVDWWAYLFVRRCLGELLGEMPGGGANSFRSNIVVGFALAR